MPVETFSEFLDVAGQWQGSVSQRSSAAKLVCLSGAGHSLFLHMSDNTGENSPVGHQKIGSTDNESSSSALGCPLHFPVCKAALGEVGLWSSPLCRWGN